METTTQKPGGAHGPRRMRHLRKSRELSFRDLARATGISASTLCWYEAGKAKPTADHAHLLADFYGVDVAEFWRRPTLPGSN